MDESCENIPPPEYPPPRCDGDPQHLKPNSLTGDFRASTPAQYSRNGGVKSTSCPPCLLPDLTPVSKYLHSKRSVLTDVNNSPIPEFGSIKDEILPQCSFDISSMEESSVSNQDGALAEPIGSCHDLANSSASSVDTIGNTTESSVKLTNQTIASSINESFDVHPPGRSKCHNVTADADPTGKMVALNKTLDAEADPAEWADSEVVPCSNTIESESAVVGTNSLFESHTSVNQLDPQNTFNVECSNLQATTGPMRVDPDPHNTFVMDGSTNLSNHQTTTSPMRVDLHDTFAMDGSANLSNHQTTTSLISVNHQNTFDVDSSAKLRSPENETFDVHPPCPSKCKDATFDTDAVSEDEPVVVVAVTEAELGLVAVSADEQVVEVSADEQAVEVSADEQAVEVSADEQALVAVGDDEPGVAVGDDEPGVAVGDDEPGVAVGDDVCPSGPSKCKDTTFDADAVSEDEPVVVTVTEVEPRQVAVGEDELELVAVSEDEPVVAVSADEQGLVAVSADEQGLVAVTEDEPVLRAVSATSSGSASVTGPGNGKDHSQSSTLNVSEFSDSPAVYVATGACNLDDTLELREALQAQLTSTPMPRRCEAEKVGENPTVVPRKLYQSHSQFVPPTNVVSDRKTFLNPNDPRVKHLLPPSASLIPGGISKKPSGLPMMRRAQGDGPGPTAALPKEATGIPRSVTEVKGISKAMVTRSTDAVAPAVGAALPASRLRKRQGAGLPLATQRAGSALRPPMTRRLAAKASGERTVQTNAAPAVPSLKIGQSPNRRSLRSGGDSSGEAALLAKRKMDVQVPSSSAAAGPSQTVKTGQSQTLKRPGSRLAVPGAKQKKMDVQVPSSCAAGPSQTDCVNCAGLRKQLEEARQQLKEAHQECKRLQDLLPSK